MGYFPFFIDIRDKKCLIAGGGKVALRKAEKLMGFGADITVVAPSICGEIGTLGVKTVYRPFCESDLDGVFFCIAASDRSEVNHYVSRLCRERGILINCVDDPEYCCFIFPALVSRGDITVGISTSGSAPAFSKYLRGRIEDILDEKTLSAAAFLKNNRRKILERLDTESKKAKAAEMLIALFYSSPSEPDEKTVNELIEGIANE